LIILPMWLFKVMMRMAKMQFCNKAFETMYGYVCEEVVGKNLDHIFSDKEVAHIVS